MEESKQKVQHIVLVHGSCHGAWCWYKVATLLESAGYGVTVPDLAASGIDSRRIEELATFADYSQPLMEIMASLPPQEKVILVGHSFGGFNIALAADRFPEKVAAAVFLTAFMPDCDSKPSYVFDKYNQQNSLISTWKMDCQFSVIGDPEKPLDIMMFGPKFLASKLYNLCQPEDLKLATTLLRPTSYFMKDLASTPAFSRDRYGSVATVYIVCSQDLVITEDFQRWMIENHPVKEVIEIKGADHMAMLSTPKELCQSLIHIAEEIYGS